MHVCLLGLCPNFNCRRVLDLSDMPLTDVKADWICPYCRTKLSTKAFGYNEDGKKTHWVTRGGKWLNRMPSKKFEIGSITVVVSANDLETPRQQRGKEHQAELFSDGREPNIGLISFKGLFSRRAVTPKMASKSRI